MAISPCPKRSHAAGEGLTISVEKAANVGHLVQPESKSRYCQGGRERARYARTHTQLASPSFEVESDRRIARKHVGSEARGTRSARVGQ